MEHAPANRYRELAEAHFKLGLAFEYSEQNEESIEQIGCAMAVLQTKLDALEASAGGKGKQVVTDDSIESDDEEIKMLKGFLSELGSKVRFGTLFIRRIQNAYSFLVAVFHNSLFTDLTFPCYY